MATCKNCKAYFPFDRDIGYAPDLCSTACDFSYRHKAEKDKLETRIAELEIERNKYKAADEALTAQLALQEAEMDTMELLIRGYFHDCECSYYTHSSTHPTSCVNCDKARAILHIT